LARSPRAADADLAHAPRIEQAFLNHAPERGAMMQARAEIVVVGVAMGVDMDHAERAALRASRPEAV
jgi:hypothetical protein